MSSDHLSTNGSVLSKNPSISAISVASWPTGGFQTFSNARSAASSSTNCADSWNWENPTASTSLQRIMQVNSITNGGSAAISPIATVLFVLRSAQALRAISVSGAIACVTLFVTAKAVSAISAPYGNSSSSRPRSNAPASISPRMRLEPSRNCSIPSRTRPPAARTTNLKTTKRLASTATPIST